MDVARRPAVSVFTATACAYSSRQATYRHVRFHTKWNGMEWSSWTVHVRT